MMDTMPGIIRRMLTAVVLALLDVGMADLVSGYYYKIGFYSIQDDVLFFLFSFLLFYIFLLLWLYKNSINKEADSQNNDSGGEKRVELSKEGKA